MDDHNRKRASSRGVVYAFSLMGSALAALSSLAVRRWGAIAFALIVAVMVMVASGLVATGRMRRMGESMWMLPVLWSAITVSLMARVLGVPLWGSLLINTFIVIAGWLIFSRGLPWWESQRGDSRR